MDGVAGRPGVGSSGTQPPASTTGLTGPYVVGTCFKVTSACWLEGYWWYVCASGGQETAAQKFALWSANRDGSASAQGSVIPAATVTSGTLTAGQFNYVPLATPVPLTIGWTYMATTGWSPAVGIPYANAQFGSGNPYSAGIVNGPLTGFSNLAGSNPDPFGNIQCAYNRVTADPAVTFPNTDSSSFNGWIDLQVTTTPPANATYRLFPSLEGYQTGVAPDYNTTNDSDGYSIGNTFALTRQCTLLKLWWLSCSGVAALPTRCAVWDVGSQAEIAGTDVTSPTWLNESGGAGAAGGGWVYQDYSASGVVLPAGRNMIAAVFIASGATWRGYSIPFWGTGGISGGPAINVGASGLNYGVMTAPSTAAGVPLQGGFSGPGLPWAFPGTWNNPENDWTDIEVAPVPVPNVPPYTASMSSM
jgi:hypothetical protein